MPAAHLSSARSDWRARLTVLLLTVTRSHKYGERDHSGEGLDDPDSQLPRYFAKSGPVDADPKKTKKDGGGKGNWYVLPSHDPVVHPPSPPPTALPISPLHPLKLSTIPPH